MTNAKLKVLFDRYFNGLATAEEEEELFLLLGSSKENMKELELLMDDQWRHMKPQGGPFDRAARDRMLSAVYRSDQVVNAPVYREISWWKRVAVAASVVLALGGGTYVYLRHGKPQENVLTYKNDIAPGKQGATLTLASGKKILLAEAVNGKLAKEAGATITKTAGGQLVYNSKEVPAAANALNTLTTARGETYKVRLPDGSEVWLNAASSLTYPANFSSLKERHVTLEGEGYFEVAKDKAHPFIVESKGQQVEVLGTHFNINAYDDENAARTTLLEGSVKLTNAASSAILRPGNQATSGGGEISIRDVDTSLVVAWKNNNFIFQRQDIHEIMRIISRWYNVEVVYSGTPAHDTFWGSVPRFNNVSKVLSQLEASGNVHFRVEGKTIYVSP